MQLNSTARAELRSATADCHERVDQLYARFDLGDLDDYGRFLRAQAQAHIIAEEALDSAGAEDVLADWPARQRAPLLRADLAALGLPVPEPEATSKVSFACPAAVLGAIYVLEGSRLGGRVLRRSVPASFPCSFLDAADQAGWRRLLEVIEERLADPAQRALAVAAATSVFALFEESGARHPA